MGSIGEGGDQGKAVVVCVTGASGYIASWVVKLLLHRGYTVRASVRHAADPEKTEHLRALDGADKRLHLFEADLLTEGSFDAAIDGCEGVFHVASPCYNMATDPKAELIDPAVKGTLNVLGSCARTKTVRRVVLTSSMASIVYSGKERNPDVVVDETWFSKPEICEQLQLWYSLAKTLAEEAAWKFCKENRIDMVTLHPGNTIGTLLQPSVNATSSFILNLVNGTSKYPNATFGWVNVKDVALAHVLAFEVPSASGRYILVETVAHYSELVKMIREMYPTLPVPAKCENDLPFTPTYIASKEKAKSLGINYISLAVSLKEAIECFKERGLITSF